MPLKIEQLVQNKYLIKNEIGRGMFGRVYLARDINLDRMVAIKELSKSDEEIKLSSYSYNDGLLCFAREARLMARFNHPNLVHVYELLREETDALYLVMEYVEGGNLKRLLEREKKLALEEALRLYMEVLSGLKEVYADPRDIVHRDVKPSNILLTKDGHAKLTDFGLAQVGDESKRSTTDNKHPGTPVYMSPEQEKTSGYLYPVSDLFSLSCVLFEMLAGVGYKQAKRNGSGKGMRELLPDAPSWLQDLLRQMLDKNPDLRLQTVDELQAMLLEGQKKQQEQENARSVAVPKIFLEEAEQQFQPWRVSLPSQVRVRSREILGEKMGMESQMSARQAPEKRKQQALILELEPGVVMEFVCVPAGEFLMGSDRLKDKDAWNNEFPQHKVFLDEYWIGKYPVTVEQFSVFVKANHYMTTAEMDGGGYIWTGLNYEQLRDADWQHPRGGGSDIFRKRNHPVTQMSWHDAAAFCAWASQVTGKKVRLSSEAEWEKAARGMDGCLYPCGDDVPVKEIVNYGNLFGDTSAVGSYPKGVSPYGVLDMAGNVWEWVNDFYDERYYQHSPVRNPSGAASGEWRVLRGGSWYNDSRFIRVTYRSSYSPSERNFSFGFRCAV